MDLVSHRAGRHRVAHREQSSPEKARMNCEKHHDQAQHREERGGKGEKERKLGKCGDPLRKQSAYEFEVMPVGEWVLITFN